MRLFRLSCALVACLMLAATASPGRADATPDPLRLVTAQADLILKIEQPRTLVEGVTQLDVFKKLQDLEAVRELYDSTNVRRALQLVSYFEKQLGAPRYELLDRLAGGGIALGVRFQNEPGTAVLVIQSRDEQLLRRFVKLAMELTKQELARQESPDVVKTGSHRGVETVQLTEKSFLAVIGSALVISNTSNGIKTAINLHLDGATTSMANPAALAEARKLLPAHPAAWLWVNLKPVHDNPVFKGIIEQTKDNGTGPIFYGGLFNIAARSPFLCVALNQQPNEFAVTLRFPRGRQGMPEAVLLQSPDKSSGSLLLLEPPNTLLTASYYLDLANYWSRRKTLLTPPELKGLEQLDKQSGFFLGGTKLGKLLQQTGPHQRLVVAHQAKPGYKIVPAQRFPAVALVLEMSDPEFARSAESVLRAAALFGTFQFSLKLVEETHGGHKIVGYRFPEDGKVPKDVGNLRFNASPCLVKVGNQFVVSSTIELARDLVDVLAKESSTPAVNPSPLRVKANSAGAAAALQSAEEQLLTQAILGQALAPDDARQQVQGFIALVERLGTFHLQTHYGRNEFHVDVRLKLSK
jgi:hypothetical protein